MAADNKLKSQPAPAQFIVRRNGERVQLSYQQMFAIGHRLWLAQDHAKAARVFEILSEITDRGPRAHIILAHCRAMLGDYASCLATLSQALPEGRFGNAASQLHNVFVLWKCTYYVDVRQELEIVVSEHPELPTLCLMLAEFLMRNGNQQKPPTLLRQAIERDRPDGAISLIAQQILPIALGQSPKRNLSS